MIAPGLRPLAVNVAERVFRAGEDPLSLGPRRHRQENRVDAYATALCLAFPLWSAAERKLKERFLRMRLEEALRFLERVSWVRIASGGLSPG